MTDPSPGTLFSGEAQLMDDGRLAMAASERARPLVYVHLDYGRSLDSWMKAYQRGAVFEENPYGYHWAQPWVRLEYSVDTPESKFMSIFRRGLKFVIGFDAIHAFRNRRRAEVADVIWTHTEAEYLGDALLMKLGLMKRVPLIGQSIWLWDKWSKWSAPKQKLHRWLHDEVTVPTTHSSLNATLGSGVLGRPVLRVPFGIEPTFEVPPSRARVDGRVCVVAPGNDRHRDWETLFKVACDNPDIDVVVLSGRRRARRLMSPDVPNFVVRRAAGIHELIAAYTVADVVAVPLTANMHASGITVALEGIHAGRPVVVTRTGGIDDYLTGVATFVDPNDASGFATAIRKAAQAGTDPERRSVNRSHVVRSGLLIKDFGQRHVLLTRLALGIGTAEEVAAISRFRPVTLDSAAPIATLALQFPSA